jgi:hypothetical protein
MGLVVAFSDATISLFSALLGAIVGGAASLAGSIVVSRWSRATDARLRLYDELIPAAIGVLQQRPFAEVSMDQIADTLHALRRASVVAGRPERHAADAVIRTWSQYERARIITEDKAREAFDSLIASLEGMMEKLERRLD